MKKCDNCIIGLFEDDECSYTIVYEKEHLEIDYMYFEKEDIKFNFCPVCGKEINFDSLEDYRKIKHTKFYKNLTSKHK